MIELVGAALGIFGRLVPEVVGYFKARQEHEQELARMQLQAQIVKEQQQAHMEEVRVQGDIQTEIARMQAMKEAVAAQSTPSGIGWVDGWSKAIRPWVTTTIVCFYIGTKVATLYTVDGPALSALPQIWDEFDRATLAAILNFWFVGRVLDKQSK